MYLTKQQEKMLDGEKGAATAILMKLLVKIGEVNKAEKLIPIRSAQIAGVSYYNVGKSIFSFFDLLSKDKLKVSVPSWLNPAGMDREKWKEMGISSNFAENQFKIIDFYEKMGIDTTLTCAPYLINHEPIFGNHLAWSESSAVSMANGFYGARTNREGGPSSLAAAIIGFTSDYGLHKEENRQPDVFVDVQTQIENLSDYSVLGYWFGETYQDSIPFFKNIKRYSKDRAKMLASAMAASGSVAHFHIQDSTPEANTVNLDEIDERAIFSESDKKRIYEHFYQIKEEADLVVIGCPHVSINDLKLINNILSKKSLKGSAKIWIFASKDLVQKKEARKEILALENLGIEIYVDTCMVVTPVVKENFKNILTNSAKAAFYLTRDARIKVNLLSLEEIMESIAK
jgi:predicted aconitase